MKAKEIRALARENLKQIPKKIYMPIGLLLVVANIIPNIVDQATDSKSWVGANIIFFLLEIAAALLTANGYIFFDRWRNKIQKGGEEPNAWCGLTGQHIARLLIYGVIEALIIGTVAVTVAVAIAAAVVGSAIPQVPVAVSIILLILLVVLLVWIELRLTYVVYVIDDDVRTGQKRSVWAEIGAGWKLTKGRVWKLLCLNLSFFGWYILTAFTLGILGIWLMPYYNLAIAETYEQSKEDRY
ncbi:membrane protein [Lactobacillus delbrueckii subsp. delbrueckii DSM 20074 = JCM 1012]|uniref:DUF975 family protein n=1 Tax=Lactobacillus delbrueckii TaxID=1584 RepID=UPI00047237FF|nr:DUF975 family protein [Lactobacillus delbrueckii]APP10472.1 hypothetical protein LD074_07810 [Lactobacillus delbrueckii subsp. delbrueckii DSM 20074 = JCM 1012]KNZ38848.1 hypothetical protein LDD39_00190 [Lactobacillus delbrueckii subsp. delbrueckii]KRK19481.1 membrane protein [Lactobacillus delbrueckii subsp. delbrueckii DSM 20074 = JCM 1012]MCT3494183.1 DUF975 family protein [Lactobacillus delbrueckii]MCT3521106.1 DUF975 family protein [Lactobacillus delbrueckii]